MTKQSHDLSNGYGIASSAFGLLAMTNGAFFKGLDSKVLLDEWTFLSSLPSGVSLVFFSSYNFSRFEQLVDMIVDIDLQQAEWAGWANG